MKLTSLLHPGWRTVGLKLMGDGTALRMQMRIGGTTTRVQRVRNGWLTWLRWKTLPEDEAFLEALMFNCPTRLAIREGTKETVEVCTNNVLLPHYQFLPLSDRRSKLYIVSRYATVESDETGDSYYDEDARRWRPVADFFTNGSLPDTPELGRHELPIGMDPVHGIPGPASATHVFGAILLAVLAATIWGLVILSLL